MVLGGSDTVLWVWTSFVTGFPLLHSRNLENQLTTSNSQTELWVQSGWGTGLIRLFLLTIKTFFTRPCSWLARFRTVYSHLMYGFGCIWCFALAVPSFFSTQSSSHIRRLCTHNLHNLWKATQVTSVYLLLSIILQHHEHREVTQSYPRIRGCLQAALIYPSDDYRSICWWKICAASLAKPLESKSFHAETLEHE